MLVALEPVLQVYVVAPLAVRVAAEPAQTEGLFTVTVGIGVIPTETVLVAAQPLVTPVSV
jgi:hypothetical protein